MPGIYTSYDSCCRWKVEGKNLSAYFYDWNDDGDVTIVFGSKQRDSLFTSYAKSQEGMANLFQLLEVGSFEDDHAIYHIKKFNFEQSDTLFNIFKEAGYYLRRIKAFDVKTGAFISKSNHL